ncbi:hypothetical protein H6P81_007017 [Aristolochia fimbriata]|uniref:Uncharacterized protein n=1 Tax=Aristolochia fimbriata TaxID=158543 RepID=A0AAV7F3G7_ARIFI|nr:hypothetical protein H6P81_007017 [Aristolochia fimbriata]
MSSINLLSSFSLPPSACKQSKQKRQPEQNDLLSSPTSGWRAVVNRSSKQRSLMSTTQTSTALQEPDFVKLEMARRSTQFAPCRWGNFFLEYRQDEQKLDEWTARAQVLKEKVKEILKDAEGSPSEIHLVDVMKRIGLGDEFESEIEEALERIINNKDLNVSHDDDHDCDLHQEALRFRVLREGGYKGPADVFERFKDEKGRKFKDSLTKDVNGLLGLYEAAFLGIRGEDILDEAIAFTTQHLQSILASNNTTTTDHLHPVLAKRVQRALEIPTHKRLPIENARDMILFYKWSCTDHQEASGTKTSKDMRTLLEYAELVFNLAQAAYQRELKELTLWWKQKGLAEKLPYTRERIVEGYFLSLSAAPQPRFFRTRICASKIYTMMTLVDDTYDAFGNGAFGHFDDLKKFTQAINRWEHAAMDELPEYMKPIYDELLILFEETGEDLKREGCYHQLDYMKESMQELIRYYLIEAEWCRSGYTPGIEEYNRVGVDQTSYHAAALPTMLFKKEASIEALERWKSRPRLLVASAAVCRFSNDFCGHKFEEARLHTVTSVQCFMKEKGITDEEEVKVLFKHLYEEGWKEMNEICLNRPMPFPTCICGLPVDFARWSELFYINTDRDEYTDPTPRTIQVLNSVLVDPIPV